MNKHIPVLLKESIESLGLKNNGIYIDVTLGGGGYSLEIIKNNENVRLISFDIDQKAINNFVNELGSSHINTDSSIVNINDKVTLVNDNFSNLKETLGSLKISEVDGIVADLGWSSNQLDQIEGLSFENLDDDLDMRFDISLGVKAYDLINALGKKEIEHILMNIGDFNKVEASKFGNEIIVSRKSKKILKVKDLNEIIERIFSKLNSRSGRNINQTKARIYQVFRVTVNSEYQNLEVLLRDGFDFLKTNGVLCIVTFHSGEEKVIEDFIQSQNKIEKVEEILPSANEIRNNVRARSSKLWVIKKR